MKVLIRLLLIISFLTTVSVSAKTTNQTLLNTSLFPKNSKINQSLVQRSDGVVQISINKIPDGVDFDRLVNGSSILDSFWVKKIASQKYELSFEILSKQKVGIICPEYKSDLQVDSSSFYNKFGAVFVGISKVSKYQAEEYNNISIESKKKYFVQSIIKICGEKAKYYSILSNEINDSATYQKNEKIQNKKNKREINSYSIWRGSRFNIVFPILNIPK